MKSINRIVFIASLTLVFSASASARPVRENQIPAAINSVIEGIIALEQVPITVVHVILDKVVFSIVGMVGGHHPCEFEMHEGDMRLRVYCFDNSSKYQVSVTNWAQSRMVTMTIGAYLYYKSIWLQYKALRALRAA